MNKLAIAAALLLTASTAQAGENYSFEIGGRTVRIHVPRGCDSPSCISISIPGVYASERRDFDNGNSDIRNSAVRKAPQAPAPVVPPAEASKPAPAVTATSPAPTVVTPPPMQQAETSPPADAAAPVRGSDKKPPRAGRETTTILATTAPAAEPVHLPAAVIKPIGPLGTWLTEKKEGRVRIEECGTNLCGYSVDSRTGRNKEKILINMKPGGSKWTGKIYDPKSGSTYSSTIAMKGNEGLRVQGCAFGGLFCGGQTWTRAD
jgi:uncharacterized protein (DUF2147 family)